MKKAHFIGICGAGMSAVAKLLIDYGWQVSGSDEGFYPPVSDYIKKHKIYFRGGYSSSNIPNDADLVVVGKSVGLTPENNEEVRATLSLGLKVKSFPEVLEELCEGKNNILAVGSYGKSTCAALIAWCLKCAGKDPSYFIGAIPVTPDESSAKGNGNIFVFEGDEYPSSNWDNSSKFLHYSPTHLLLTSLTHDHVNVFKTHEDYKDTFVKLMRMVPRSGLIVACADGESVRETILNQRLSGKAIFYSIKGNTQWHIANMKLGEISSFDILKDDKVIVRVRTSLLGMHNFENILGVGALLFSLNLVTPQEFLDAIASFEALSRRLDKKSDKTMIPVYEGFGSSFAKAKAAISAMKTHFPERKLVVLFEPYSFGWRKREALDQYKTVFDKANRVLIYKLQESSSNEITLGDILSCVQGSGCRAEDFKDINSGLDLLNKYIDGSSAILILSSGGFDGFVEITAKWLENKFPLH